MENDFPEAIVTNKMGYTLFGFVTGNERDLIERCVPLTASVVMLLHGDDCLLGYNHNRHQWELPGGRIEPGESPRACASRELAEESGQSCRLLDFRGLSYVRRPNGEFKYTSVYSRCVSALDPFVENEEWNSIDVFSPTDLPSDSDSIHAYVLNLLYDTVKSEGRT